MADFNWRTINIDALDPESAYNFDLSTLTPTVQPTSTQDVQTLNGQIRQLLRGGNAEGALRGGLENVPYGADEQGKVDRICLYLPAFPGPPHDVDNRMSQSNPPNRDVALTATHIQIRGSELCDTLMKYLYKGMGQGSNTAAHPSGNTGAGGRNLTPQATGGFTQASGRNFGGGEGGMSVFLSWHEKLVEMVGPGSIVRVMSDRRTV
ncbi:hypothetical protein LTR91_019819 [Friedmanniomyces endolithicus]|uniref:Actin-related protein 2/3 complex subunit 5 n=1 Tax=Friedmanniomyces endolithicus TaxID=329885 RepID=A0AAN6K509_9PEZI|nr:hypothetical protein LTR57_020557 [Friedmanniomyces endolithicus]KAK0961621.1 hypothetical protein LTR91_019819 [Friedmanniomyces endolithicus]KAK0968308.1 hypothetical protein LTS01_016794 [Friedmanniomyces endolithicus]KAK1042689.1 hypothetical protein LTS16_008671 [Friedmanniomyces endolithicus]KAK1062203.1 hypothetical protein LTR33_012550 [Friedmanniomyces endolithicus]